MAAELLRIKSMCASLSPAQKRLSDYILRKGEAVILLSVHELARGAGEARRGAKHACTVRTGHGAVLCTEYRPHRSGGARSMRVLTPYREILTGNI